MKKTLKYFLLFYSFFLVSLISAAVVNHVLKGGQKLNKYKGWILEFAQIPGNAYRFLGDNANSDGRYIKNENLNNGFTYYSDKSLINDDFLLISTFEPSKVDSLVIKLVEIRTSKEIHRWGFNEKTFNDVIDISNPALISVIHSISMVPFGGYVNSVAVSNGKLAAAVESTDKQAAGKIVVFNTSTYAEIKSINVGALPDMVTFTNDGNYIISANEGEPSDNYVNDPEGSVSIIKVSDYSVKTINFSTFD